MIDLKIYVIPEIGLSYDDCDYSVAPTGKLLLITANKQEAELKASQVRSKYRSTHQTSCYALADVLEDVLQKKVKNRDKFTNKEWEILLDYIVPIQEHTVQIETIEAFNMAKELKAA